MLLVEDDPETAALYAAFLEDECRVEIASSGSEAIERLSEDIDVVLLDRRMPGMDGDRVIADIRRRFADIPIAMVTAVEPDTDIVELPIDEYLSKPIDGDSLRWTVRVLANRSRFEERSRELFQLAAKRASIDRDSEEILMDDEAYESLLDRMRHLQTSLDETVRGLYDDRTGTISRPDPGETEMYELVEEIYDHSLPPEIESVLESYLELDHSRSPFIWKWVHRLAPQNELPIVESVYTDKLSIDKTLVVLFITVVDDILEKKRDRATFLELSKIPFEGQVADPTADGVDAAYVSVGERIWQTLIGRLGDAPKFDDYADIFRFDLKQALTAIEYSDIASHNPGVATMADLERYESHNMVMLAYADVDFMHSDVEIGAALGPLRDAVLEAQMMARIGNWVSTWERELSEGDFSAGPIVYALETGLVTPDELERARRDDDVADELKSRIRDHGIEDVFLSAWERHYDTLCRINEQLPSIELEPFIDGTEEILRYHLTSRGLK